MVLRGVGAMTCVARKGNASEVNPLYYGIALEVAQISAVTLEKLWFVTQLVMADRKWN